ncbi:16S rRNA (uracil(1498)-N(3))-methyltransferase [Coraliomargarita parva]|uniref:16S rRNA (uracil(1498)-N(3))-methyltransferase n=1 Tax=Coraliomargarita parva TaxID=3014050 RepID=UPI0022B52DAB|nr:RsmE family RNA methyltransferase [Coraliomargarita parva]
MNLILFEQAFDRIQLSKDDPRAAHLRKVLRVELGTLVFVGFVNGLRARAKVVALEADGSVALEVVGTEPAPAALPLTLLVGLPRPHTAKRILFEAASLGVQTLAFFEAERGEPSYARSSLWQTDEWRERLRLGTEQSFGTHVPEVVMYPDLQTALSQLYDRPVRVALDNYEAAGALAAMLPQSAGSGVLAFGPERGWSPNERDTLRRNGWALAHLGPQVLRAETAVVATVAAVASQLGYWKDQTATSL